MDLHVHSLVCLHGIVLKYLRAETGGTGMAIKQQANTYLSIEKGIRIMNQVQICFLYVRESYKQLRRQSLLVLDVVHNTKKLLV
jgi:hypothetical protein